MLPLFSIMTLWASLIGSPVGGVALGGQALGLQALVQVLGVQGGGPATGPHEQGQRDVQGHQEGHERRERQGPQGGQVAPAGEICFSSMPLSVLQI